MKFNGLSLKIDADYLLKNISKRPNFVIRPCLNMLNVEVDSISLQELEYEMYRTDYPVDYTFLK